ncbi:hypothetical protein GQ473_03790, partial [archaeon]|nr:hypothetical protein [archaeon]
RPVLVDSSERIELTLASDTDGDYWQGYISTVVLGDYSVDDLIHSTGVKYSIKYKSEVGDFVTDLMPVSCDNNFQPTVTLLGFPLFNASTWIILTILYLLFKWNSWARQHKNYNLSK